MSSGGNERGACAPVVLASEEQDRADLYALVSRLFFAPADPSLLAEISGSACGEEGTIGIAWQGLRIACSDASPASVRQEFDDLFLGVGRAEVTPYLSAYAGGAPDAYVVALRDRLGAWGLARRNAVFEVEDHVSGLCDVMRWLIVSGRGLAEQKRFFGEFVSPGAGRFCDAVQQASTARFYKPVAIFAGAFFRLEHEAFALTQDDEAG